MAETFALWRRTVLRIWPELQAGRAWTHRRRAPRSCGPERLLVATGRRPVTDGLGLETVGVKVGERGEVVVDEHLRTHNPRTWAAGDIIGHPQFVYVAAASSESAGWS